MVRDDERLTKHFTLGELTRSPTAVRLGLDNRANSEIAARLKLLATMVLEPVRAHYGAPVDVTSGYRAPAVNRACGGASSSQHQLGEAADFTVRGVSNIEVCRWIAANLAFDQLIYEFGPGGWVHCSYRLGRVRKSLLTATRTKSGTVYFPGIRG